MRTVQQAIAQGVINALSQQVAKRLTRAFDRLWKAGEITWLEQKAKRTGQDLSALIAEKKAGSKRKNGASGKAEAPPASPEAQLTRDLEVMLERMGVTREIARASAAEALGLRRPGEAEEATVMTAIRTARRLRGNADMSERRARWEKLSGEEAERIAKEATAAALPNPSPSSSPLDRALDAIVRERRSDGEGAEADEKTEEERTEETSAA